MTSSTDDLLVIARTPLRLTLGGGGTDLPFYSERFGGKMLTAAISLSVTVVARQGRVDDCYRYSHEATFTGQSPEAIDDGFIREALARTSTTMSTEIASMGPVPAGTGLGSSAAFCIGLLSALHHLAGHPRSQLALVEEAFELEANGLGRPVGKQDHYACGLGGVRQIELDRSGAVKTAPLGASAATIDALERRLMLFYTGTRRDSALPLLPPQAPRDLNRRIEQLHYIRSLGEATALALNNGDLNEVPRLMREHWEAKQQSSDSRWDCWISLARRYGARAGKIVGAGCGGFVLLYVEPEKNDAVMTALTKAGSRHIPFRFMHAGTTITSLDTQLDASAGRFGIDI